MNKLILIGLTIFLLAFEVQAKTNDSKYKVTRSDNLSSIIKKHYKGSKLTQAQLAIAVLAENPKAFGRGNMNALALGKQLVLPRSSNLQLMNKVDARKLVAKHNSSFKTKKRMSPPFAGYSPTSNNKDVNALLKSTQELQKGLGELDQERVALEARIKMLLEVKQRKDKQLKELENKIKQTDNNQQ